MTDHTQQAPYVGLIMGSQSDWATLGHAAAILDALAIPHESKIVSAHRTPDRMYDYAKSAQERGLSVIIAGAGGAAHLPGMVAALTPLPVIGVPVESTFNHGLDSLLSIAQMPAGVPVASMAVGKHGARNAALLSAAILGTHDENVMQRLTDYRAAQSAEVAETPDRTGDTTS
jgi:5-(carboxyamino)imidazole ribonucleotide mutase